MNRDDALALMERHIQTDNLRKHCLAVEAAMRAYAQKFGADEELWSVVALVHDHDWEEAPDTHPQAGADRLKQLGYSDEVVDAVLSHADYTGVPRQTLLDKTLYAVDELTGLLTAVALVRPSKSLLDVDLAAVKKKWKDKAFARGAKREDIAAGAAELGVPLDEHIEFVLAAMKGKAAELGLAGS